MSDYVLGHGQAMMRRFKKRARLDGSRFIKPVLPLQGLVVDVGCGNAALADWIAQTRPTLNIIAIDQELHQLAADLPPTGPNLAYIAGNAYHLPLQDDCVDLLYLHAVCMYLNPLISVLAEAYRVLKTTGIIALRNGVSVMNNMELFVDGAQFNKVLNHALATHNDNPKVAFELPKQLESLGFSPLECKTTIETSNTAEELAAVAQATIELLDGTIGQLALNDDLLSATELIAMKQGIISWSKSSKAYNKAIWIEHIYSK